MKRTIALGISVGLASLVLTGLVDTAVAEDINCGVEVEGDPVAFEEVDGLDSVGCDLEGVIVESGEVSAEIPEPGVTVEVHGLAGSETSDTFLRLAVAYDGTITATDVEPDVETSVPEDSTSEASSGSASGAGYSRCKDYSRSSLAGNWRPGVFYLNSSERRPSNISKAAFESITTASLNVWKNRSNTCSMQNAVDVPGSISVGNWTYDSNFTAAGSCGTRDSRNVIDFGGMSKSGLLGVACTFSVNGKPVEADVRIDTSSRSWVTTVSGCSGSKFDLRSVMTHELGHILGLGHAHENGKGDLTMSPNLTPCDASARLLGAGDVTSLYANHRG